MSPTIIEYTNGGFRLHFDCSIFMGLLVSFSAEQQDAYEVEVCVVDVGVPPDLAPGVV